MDRVAMGRASSRFSEMGSPVSSQKAIGTILDPAQGRVDLGDQLALAVAGAKFQLPFGLGGGTIGEIGMRHRLGFADSGWFRGSL